MNFYLNPYLYTDEHTTVLLLKLNTANGYSVSLCLLKSIFAGSDRIAPYTFIGDEAFPLKRWLMRPYPGRTFGDSLEKRIYNFRLSRARRTIEVKLVTAYYENYG